MDGVTGAAGAAGFTSTCVADSVGASDLPTFTGATDSQNIQGITESAVVDDVSGTNDATGATRSAPADLPCSTAGAFVLSGVPGK